MKMRLLFLLLILNFSSSYSQSIQINQITPTSVSGGINVNLLVTTYNGAGYLSNDYTIIGNTINLSVCYWFNVLQPVYQMSNDFFIPIANSASYTINVSIFHSMSSTVCDYFSVGPTSAVNFLDVTSFEKFPEKFALFPNPTTGKIEFNCDQTFINKFSVFDNLGRMIKSEENSIKNSFDLSGFNDGIYFINFETKNGNFTQKIILNK
jgi:hypothetical protein